MALQYSVAVNNARLDAVESTTGASALLKIFTSAVPANCAAADGAGLICTIALPADWMNAAAAGVKTLLGSWSASASGTGVAQSFRIKNSGDTTCHIQGTVGQGSGDLSLNNTNIANGQTVSVTTFTLNSANT